MDSYSALVSVYLDGLASLLSSPPFSYVFGIVVIGCAVGIIRKLLLVNH